MLCLTWSIFYVFVCDSSLNTMPARCALGCPMNKDISLHVFPDPNKYPDRFKLWVQISGGTLVTDDDYVKYRKKMICDIHFTEKERNRNRRVNALAVPSLHLKGLSSNAEVPVDAHTSSISRNDTIAPMDVDVAPAQPCTSKYIDTDKSTTAVVLQQDSQAFGMDPTVSINKTKEWAERKYYRSEIQRVKGLSSNAEVPVDAHTSSISRNDTIAPMDVDVAPAQPCTSKYIDTDKPTTGVVLAQDCDAFGVGPIVSIKSSQHLLSNVWEEHSYFMSEIQRVKGLSSNAEVPVDAHTSSISRNDTIAPMDVDVAPAQPCTSKYIDTATPKKTVQSKKAPSVVINQLKKSRREVKYLKTEISRLKKRGVSFKSRLTNAEKVNEKTAFQKVTKNMTSPAKIFTRMQCTQAKKKPNGRRFNLEEKILSLSLYKKSPKCYPLLAKYFTLPSSKSLKRLLAEINLQPGINDLIFTEIKNTVKEMDIEDRLCTVMFDEMSLSPQIHYDSAKDELKGFSSIDHKKIADHVLVFMAKGIKKNFKQPVAYYFTTCLNKNDMKNIIKNVLHHVLGSGLKVLCTVCDQSTINVSAINELVNETKEEFKKNNKQWEHDVFTVGKHQIIPLYDVPHLLKGLRNNILTKDLKYAENGEEKIMKWEYLQMLYQADKSYGELRLLQKLTEEHVNPQKIRKMRVKTAAQIFSHSVAVATEHLTGRGDLPQECRQMITIIKLIDNLFDSLNSNTFHVPNGKIYKGCVKKNSCHHELWKKAIGILKTVKYIKKKKVGDEIRLTEVTVPSVNNFIKTIEGIQSLWKILSQKYCLDAMLTRNFNQDPLENFFGNIRSYGVRNNAPNCVAFESAFKALLLNNFNSPHSLRANCEKDDNKCLQSLDFFLTAKTVETSSNVSNEHCIIFNDELFETLNENESATDSGQRSYVCGWVLTKCFKNVTKRCNICKNDLTGNKKNSSYIAAREYTNTSKWLCYPSDECEKCFEDIQNIVVSILKRKDLPKTKLKKTINLYTDILMSFPFKCDVHKLQLQKYFQNTTSNIIIYSWCRSINRILCGKLEYTGDDQTKLAAQLYCNKHKHYKSHK